MVLPDTDSLSTFGGPMTNYSEVVDPTTDETADHRNAYVADVAAMTHTTWRAIRSFLVPTSGTTGIADPSTGFVHDAVWGSSASVKPVGTYIAVGTIDVIWPTMVTDELGDTHYVSFKRSISSIESPDGTWIDAKSKVTNARTVRVYVYDNTPTLADLAGNVVTIWVR